jgi:hypothetical protein
MGLGDDRSILRGERKSPQWASSAKAEEMLPE